MNNHLTPPGLSRRHALAAGASILAASGLAACGSSGGSNSSSSKSLTIGVPVGWDEGVAVSNLFKVILSEEGYDVDLSDAGVGVIYTGLSKGDYDVMLDAWLPTTHESYMEVLHGPVRGRRRGPGHVVHQRQARAGGQRLCPHQVDRRAGWRGRRLRQQDRRHRRRGGTDPEDPELRHPRLRAGGHELPPSSSDAMLAELAGAMSKGDNIVVTLWSPHWAYSAYEIRDLEDPKNAFGDAEQIHALGRKGLSDDMPEIATLFSEFTMTDEQLSSLEEVMFNQDEGKDEEKSINTWLEDNPDFRSSLSI